MCILNFEINKIFNGYFRLGRFVILLSEVPEYESPIKALLNTDVTLACLRRIIMIPEKRQYLETKSQILMK